jgi:hypothetical protein
MLGGPRELREHLGVAASDLAAWLTGQREPPAEILLKALDLILEDLDAGAPRLRKLNEPPRD